MMNKLFTSKSYYYFDQFAQLQSTKLNWVEIILRKLGFFKHTHLKEVVKKGYEHTLSGRFSAKFTKEKALVTLFSKSVYEHKLPDYIDSEGEVLKLSVRYLASKSQIDLIQFKVNNETLSFSKKEERYVIGIPSFEGKMNDTQESIKERFNRKEAKTISKLVNHIIQDSSASPLASTFRFLATDYRTFSSTSNPPFNLNTLQARELHNLNWVYERLIKDVIPKSSYCPKGKPLDNYPTLSLSFGFNNL